MRDVTARSSSNGDSAPTGRSCSSANSEIRACSRSRTRSNSASESASSTSISSSLRSAIACSDLEPLERDDFIFESSSRSSLFVEHDLYRKPVSTFRDHALGRLRSKRHGCCVIPEQPGRIGRLAQETVLGGNALHLSNARHAGRLVQ